jgi:hypothetical protein
MMNMGGESSKVYGHDSPRRCASQRNAPSGNVTIPWAITSEWPVATGPLPGPGRGSRGAVDDDVAGFVPDPPGNVEDAVVADVGVVLEVVDDVVVVADGSTAVPVSEIGMFSSPMAIVVLVVCAPSVVGVNV